MGIAIKVIGALACILGIVLAVMIDWKFYILMLSGLIMYFAELIMEGSP